MPYKSASCEGSAHRQATLPGTTTSSASSAARRRCCSRRTPGRFCAQCHGPIIAMYGAHTTAHTSSIDDPSP